MEYPSAYCYRRGINVLVGQTEKKQVSSITSSTGKEGESQTSRNVDCHHASQHTTAEAVSVLKQQL